MTQTGRKFNYYYIKFMKKYLKLLLIVTAVAFIVPQVTLASWWNPFSWGMWNSIFHKTEQIKTSVCTCPSDIYILVGDTCTPKCAMGPGPRCMMPSVKCSKNQIVGGDKDAHGCIGSAGYSWCETKQKCLRVWEEKCEILSDIYPTFSDLKWGDVSKKIINEPVTNVVISGYEITANGTINNNTDASKFFTYYKKLSGSGWVVDNYFAADGILGSQVGYNNGGNYIVLGYTITPGKVTSGANQPLQWTCPCNVKYTIFTGQSETGQCLKDSDCSGLQYKCINRTCQISGQKNPTVCPMYCLQNMLCGSDGKDYCNECLAKAAGATVVHQGKCKK